MNIGGNRGRKHSETETTRIARGKVALGREDVLRRELNSAFCYYVLLFFSGVVFIAQGDVVQKAGIIPGHHSIPKKSFYLVPWRGLDSAWIVLHCVNNPTDTKRE